MGTFGAAFTSGASSGPLYVAVLGNFQTQIFVLTIGTKTNQVGFVVKASNGTTIYKISSGTTFTAATTLGTFRPLGWHLNKMELFFELLLYKVVSKIFLLQSLLSNSLKLTLLCRF